ncbi:MAG: aminotransferase class IV [Alistipes sp.]|nr:aminotransferase class IV [Alistipes sp.]
MATDPFSAFGAGPLFIETIRVDDRCILRPEPHLRRMRETVREVFGTTIELPAAAELLPADCPAGLVKCRILYDRAIRRIECTPYEPRRIASLRLVEACDGLDYRLKRADRRELEALRAQRGACDEVLIVRGGAITDTSYSNVVFFDGRRYVTPDTCLLAGVRRHELLRSGRIVEERITPRDLERFERVWLINAMLGLDDDVSLPVAAIRCG